MNDFTGATFAYQAVTPVDDAIVRRAILPDGILTGCELSYSGTTLTLGAGHLMICGRQIRVPSAVNYAITDATSGFARLLITVDLTRTATKDTFDQVTASVQYATALDGFADLEQSDINAAGTIYQVAVCVVSLGSGGITGIESQLGLSRAEGGGLNFKVVGGLTQPTDPAENTIWGSTDAEIPDWSFSASEPSAPEEGEIWFSLGTESDAAFNALRKNTLIVYPIKCRQYVSGAWELRIAYIYKNGEWVQFSDLATYLFQAPEGAIVSFVSSKESAATVTIGTDKITMTYSTEMNGISAVRTKNVVDLTNFSVLCFRAVTTALRNTDVYSPVVCISTKAFTASSRKTEFQAMVDLTADSVEKVYTIDISAISGSYYVGCWGAQKTEIYEIYLME